MVWEVLRLSVSFVSFWGRKHVSEGMDPPLWLRILRAMYSVRLLFVGHMRIFTRNYAVYWSQLTANRQCSLRPVS